MLANALNVLDDVNHGCDAPVDRDGIELPLAEGPPSVAEVAAQPKTAEEWQALNPELSPELCELRVALNAGSDDKPVDDDGEQADWREPLTAFRPRSANRPTPPRSAT